jgi:hypothetical protein
MGIRGLGTRLHWQILDEFQIAVAITPVFFRTEKHQQRRGCISGRLTMDVPYNMYSTFVTYTSSRSWLAIF